MPKTVTAYLGLGGNLGDVVTSFASATCAIGQLPGTKLIAKSKLYRTPPWGFAEQPDFLNACVKIETQLPPEVLMEKLLKIEHAHKRTRSRGLRFGPRTLDIDILNYGDVEMQSEELKIPHPELFNRAFVLIPLADIAADVTIAGKRVGEAAASCEASGITPLKEVY
jgi:2-amino-4-hydroxy-6-hydroxymethyldihydropteridine diphosphokinase